MEAAAARHADDGREHAGVGRLLLGAAALAADDRVVALVVAPALLVALEVGLDEEAVGLAEPGVLGRQAALAHERVQAPAPSPAHRAPPAADGRALARDRQRLLEEARRRAALPRVVVPVVGVPERLVLVRRQHGARASAAARAAAPVACERLLLGRPWRHRACSSSGKLRRRPLLLEVEPAPASSCCANPRDVILTPRTHTLKVFALAAKRFANDALENGPALMVPAEVRERLARDEQG